MRQYTEVQPKLWKNLYQFYKDNAISSLPQQEQLAKLSDFLQQQGFAPNWASTAAELYINILARKDIDADALSSFPQELAVKMAALTKEDQGVISKVIAKEPLQIARLLLAFVTYARAYPHSSSWIFYDKKTIMYLSGLDKLRVAEQQSLTNYLHAHYNLNMQVVGSTQPIPCFRFEWQKPQTDDTSLIVLGPLTPQTLSAYIEQGQIATQQQQQQQKEGE